MLFSIFIAFLFFTVFIGWSVFVGWLLTLILGFTLFEGSLLGMIASAMGVHTLLNIFQLEALLPSLPIEDDDNVYTDSYNYDIPEERFFKGDDEKTWGAWFQYVIANMTYDEMLDSQPTSLRMMDEKQKKELAIRLAEISFSVLQAKAKRTPTKDLSISVKDLRRQMKSMNMHPYDDEILTMTVDTVELNLAIPLVNHIFSKRLWDVRANVP